MDAKRESVARESVAAQVHDVMAGIFDEDLDSIDDISRSSVPGWDSLRHVELMLSLEDVFGVRFETAEMGSLESLGAITDAVVHHLEHAQA